MKIQSTPLMFIDQTDSRKLEVYIKSNLPTVQIYNSNTGAYTPDWREGENLVLSMDVFLDSRNMTNAEYSGTTIKWYKNDVEMSDGLIEDISDDKRKITIKDNILKDNAIITYACEAEYQGIKASSRITFSRVDTGRNGVKGADGTSVKILGNAKSVSPVSNTSYYTITYDAGAVVAAALGDAYVYGGELYVCSVLNGGQDGKTDYFVNVGAIQGEAAKSLSLIGNAQVFRIDKENNISPSSIDITAHTVNFTDEQKTEIQWEYRTTTNGTWSSITSGMVSVSNNIVKIDGNAFKGFAGSDFISIRATFIDGEETYQDVLTVYKTFDGIDGAKGDTASMAFLTNENTSFPAGADGKTNVLTTFRTNIVAYNGTEKVMPTIGSISDIYGNLPEGMSVTPNKGTAYAKVKLTPDNAIISDLYSDKDTKNTIDKSKLINGDSFVVGDYLYQYDSVNKNFKSNTTTVDGTTYLDRIVANNEITLLFFVPTGKNLGQAGNAVGEITIPITSPISTNLLLSWTKINAGDLGLPGSDAITFQVYSNNGYTLSTSVPTIALQTFAYIGDVEIKAGATYQWYRHNGTDWVAISGATNDYFNVSKDDVSFSNNYMCKMQFNSAEYVGVVTIEDKNDEHRVFASKPSNYFAGDLWVVGNDYIPSGFVVGSMLKAEHTNTAYADSDWGLATRYDEEIDDLKSKTGEYGQYFSINEAGGLQVGDATINDNVLYVGRVETTTISTKEANIESPLTVSGRYSGSTMLQAPIINLGNFSLVIESNGSLSIIANT